MRLIAFITIFLIVPIFVACSSSDNSVDGDLDFEFEKWEEEQPDGDGDADLESKYYERIKIEKVDVYGHTDRPFTQILSKRWDPTESSVEYPKSVIKIIPWQDGGAYIAASNGLWRYNTNNDEGQQLYRVANPKNPDTGIRMESFDVIDMAMGYDETLYLIASTDSDYELFKIIDNSKDVVTAVSCELNRSPKKIAAIGPSQWIHIATTGDVFMYNGSTCDSGYTTDWPDGKIVDMTGTTNDKIALIIYDSANELDNLWIKDTQWEGFTNGTSVTKAEELTEGLIGGSLRSVIIDTGEDNSKLDVWVGGSEGIQKIDRSETMTTISKLPFSDVNDLLLDNERNVWAATSKGVIKFDAQNDRWKLYNGLRWLVDDNVTTIGLDSEGGILVGHENGLTRLYRQSWTLKDKADYFEQQLEDRHFRTVNSKASFFARCKLEYPGNADGNCEAEIEEDEALRTGMYALAEIFRAKSNIDSAEKADAREKARKGLSSLMELIKATHYKTLPEIEGLPARSISERNSIDLKAEGFEQWNRSDSYDWLGDTPDTSLIGHVLLFSFYYDLFASDDEKDDIRKAAYKIVDHLLANNFNLLDVDYEFTTDGRFNTEWTTGSKGQEGVGGLRALELLALLRSVVNMYDGDPEDSPCWQTYVTKADDEGLAELVKKQKTMSDSRMKNHALDLNAFVSYLALLRIADVKVFRDIYLEAIEADFQIERPEQSPLFNFVFGCYNGHNYDLEQAIATMQSIPLDMVDRRIDSCERNDVEAGETSENGLSTITTVLPPDERKLMRLDGNPFECQWSDTDDESGGIEELDPLYYIFPYWLGRYCEIISEPQE